jgi:hypothetical protein
MAIHKKNHAADRLRDFIFRDSERGTGGRGRADSPSSSPVKKII